TGFRVVTEPVIPRRHATRPVSRHSNVSSPREAGPLPAHRPIANFEGRLLFAAVPSYKTHAVIHPTTPWGGYDATRVRKVRPALSATAVGTVGRGGSDVQKPRFVRSLC